MDRNKKLNKLIPTSMDWKFIRNFCKNELTQNEKLSINLVHRILFSKRLLVDHVECLEGCLPTIDSVPTSEVFTLCNTSLIVASTILQKLITPRSLKFTVIPFSIVATGFCCFYLAKKISDVRLKYIERETEKLIDAIDKFGNCIKRNITYFNEILAMKASELIESRQIERAWDCITAIKEVVDILYESTRILEKNYKLPASFTEFYHPMEELRECDYFTSNVTDYSPKNIKDFYNIFAYVQSQFLLRLAFTVSQDSTVKFLRKDISEIESLIRQHVNEEEEHFANLSIELKRKQQLEAATFHYQQTHQIKTGPVAVLKESSLKLSACIIAVAEECQKLDVILHKINVSDNDTTKSAKSEKNDGNQVLEVANSMRSIENSLVVCCDDFQRLTLVYNRFLGSKLNPNESRKDIDNNFTDNRDINRETEWKNVDEEFEEEKSDEFYAYVHDEKAELENAKKCTTTNPDDYSDFELINLDEKMTKNKFRPVLKQLRHKINPIREEMLEKERRVLQLKGIDVENLMGHDKSSSQSIHHKRFSDDEDGETEDGSADEIEADLKKHKTDSFAEMRNFLAQKQAVNVFGGLQLPNNENVAAEDILE